jgi:polyphosphate glucokinase
MKTLLGLDIGGSGIKGALVDIDSGELATERKRIPTPAGAHPLDVAEVVGQLVGSFKYSGLAGCGFPAVVRHGIVRTAANIDRAWIGRDVNWLLSDVSRCKILTVNDADAAGTAEMAFGAGRDQKGVVLILTLGTGIGSAIFVDGKLVPNLELGHISIRGRDAETRASDAVRQANNLSWKKYAQRLQEYIEAVEALVWPDLIIIGGGISKQSNEFLPLIKSQAKIIPAQLLNQAGIVGAAMYAHLNS